MGNYTAVIYRRAIEIYKKEGLRSLLSSMQLYIFRRYNIHMRACKLQSMIKGSKTHQIGDNAITVPLEKDYQIKRFCTVHNEKILLDDMIDELNENEIIYDIGAYLGWHTLTAASIATEGMTVAFEPHPQSYDRLTEVVETTAKGDVQLHNLALSNENGTSMINEANTSSANLFVESENGIEIKSVRGDGFIEREGLPFPTTIKIDVEGSEVSVLRGLEKTISRSECRLIYCELHPDTAPEREEVNKVVRDLLKQYGFKVSYLDHNRKNIIKATR